MPDNFWLSDGQWAAIAPRLPMVHTGPVRQDDRRIISGIVHRLREGCRWRALPSEYGPYTTVFNRYNRWSKRGCGRTFSPRCRAVPSRRGWR
jgi:transposase